MTNTKKTATKDTAASADNTTIVEKAKREIQLTDRVFIENTRNWSVGFRAIESAKDIVIPASAKKYAQLNVAEVMAQIQFGNVMFCGIDGIGNNAYLKILDNDIRKYVF